MTCIAGEALFSLAGKFFYTYKNAEVKTDRAVTLKCFFSCRSAGIRAKTARFLQSF